MCIQQFGSWRWISRRSGVLIERQRYTVIIMKALEEKLNSESESIMRHGGWFSFERTQSASWQMRWWRWLVSENKLLSCWYFPGFLKWSTNLHLASLKPVGPKKAKSRILFYFLSLTYYILLNPYFKSAARMASKQTYQFSLTDYFWVLSFCLDDYWCEHNLQSWRKFLKALWIVFFYQIKIMADFDWQQEICKNKRRGI